MAKILLVEDDDSMLSFLLLALRRVGHEVHEARDGSAAWDALCSGADGYFDLLLTDIVMPGLDGVELAQKAVALQPNLKVMFVTGFAAMALLGNEEEAGQAPENAKVLSKPFHLNDLVAQVDQLLSA